MIRQLHLFFTSCHEITGDNLLPQEGDLSLVTLEFEPNLFLFP